ncbi:MAG: phosphopyruvate hydratase [Patescibacteria group bacterium]
MAKITYVRGYEILDSRGNPTVRAVVELQDGSVGTASVPSGASTGSHEALELRDGDKKRYNGKGVLKAVANINNELARAIKGMDASEQRLIDDKMCKLDGTENKSRLGANALLGVSLAVAHAASQSISQPLYRSIRSTFKLKLNGYTMPQPTMNILNGGKHADSGLNIQEFMVIPMAKTLTEQVRKGAEIFHALHDLLKKKGLLTLVGDEGGFAPTLSANEKALSYIVKAIELAGYIPGKDAYLGMDLAASEFYDQKSNLYYLTPSKGLRSDQMIELLEMWRKKYPIILAEDPLSEDDWDGWQTLTRKLGKKLIVVGDDLFVTNLKRLAMGVDKKVANAILIKLNQIGTLTETIDCIMTAKDHGYKVIISHRSGETGDTTIADLAVAVNAEFIKTGSLSRSDRVEKYNRLMEIEYELTAHQ